MTIKLSAESQNRADQFIADVIENNKVIFMLHPEAGVFLCTSNEFFDEGNNAAPVIPVWSSKYLPYAKQYANELKLKEIGFDEFYQGMLPAMANDGLAIGLNWDHEGFGKEVLAKEVYEEITERLKK